jgi:hypothetical protein
MKSYESSDHGGGSVGTTNCPIPVCFRFRPGLEAQEGLRVRVKKQTAFAGYQ